MSTAAFAALHRRAQYVADCALLALYTDDEWHKNNLQSALAEFDKARAGLGIRREARGDD